MPILPEVVWFNYLSRPLCRSIRYTGGVVIINSPGVQDKYKQGIISVNGETFTSDAAKISASDRGFLFGDSIFEVFVAFGSKVLDTKAHLDRLRKSAEMCEIDIPWSDEQLSFEIEHSLSLLNCPKAYIRLVVTRGDGIGLSIPMDAVPSRVIYCLPAKVQSQEIYSHGLKLKKTQMPYTKRGATAKTSNYQQSIIAVKKAKKNSYDDVLWVNSEGEFTETSSANIFLLSRIGDQLEIATPPAQSGLLVGITRTRIIELLYRAKIPVTERVIHIEELARFDEGFVCSTVRGLVPVTQIDQHRMHSTRNNAIFHHISRLYDTWVESQIGQRVDWNTGLKRPAP